MTSDEFSQAVFWHQWVCLDCEAVFDAPDSASEAECPACGRDAVYSAEFLQRVARQFAFEGDGDGDA